MMFSSLFGGPPTEVLSKKEVEELKAPERAAAALELNRDGIQLILPATVAAAHVASMASLMASSGVTPELAKKVRRAAQDANEAVKNMARGIEHKYISAADMFANVKSDNAADKPMRSLRYDYTKEQVKDKMSAAAILKIIRAITAESERATGLTREVEEAVKDNYRDSAKLFMSVATLWMKIAEGIADILRATVKNPELAAEADMIISDMRAGVASGQKRENGRAAAAVHAAEAKFRERQAVLDKEDASAVALGRLYTEANRKAREHKESLIRWQKERDEEAEKEHLLHVYLQDLINYSDYTRKQAHTVEIAERYTRTTFPPPYTKTPTVDWYVDWMKTTRRSLISYYRNGSLGYYSVIGQYVDKYPEDIFYAWVSHMKRFVDPREFVSDMVLMRDVERQAKTFLDGLLRERYRYHEREAVRMVPYEAAVVATRGLDVEEEMRKRLEKVKEVKTLREAGAFDGGGTRKRRAKKTRRHRAKVLSRKE